MKRVDRDQKRGKVDFRHKTEYNLLSCSSFKKIVKNWRKVE